MWHVADSKNLSLVAQAAQHEACILILACPRVADAKNLSLVAPEADVCVRAVVRRRQKRWESTTVPRSRRRCRRCRVGAGGAAEGEEDQGDAEGVGSAVCHLWREEDW